MKTLALALSLLALAFNASAADSAAPGISPASPQGKALVKKILAAPAVRGALAQIKESVAKSGNVKCFAPTYELSMESFKMHAGCNGGYGEEGEFSELVTIEGFVFENNTVRIDNIQFNVAG